MNETSAPEQSAKERILACSRKMFSENTFAQVSLKDIASHADVSVALIVKHFHNKTSLFEATVDFTDSSAALFAGPFATLGQTAVIETLTAPENAPYSMARTITVTAGDPESLSAIGRRIKSDLLMVLEGRITREAPGASPAPPLRAQQALALLIGLSVMRRFGDTDFAAYPQDTLVEHYGQVLQSILDGH
ncbi:transcriptional regulator [Corynebacterium phocae]|uniref:Transcriptional regulator n=1 Tax=Corynebacterium phocae TaxID=161895 RepID=A0A1L7D3H7_9CORY|nr:TetR/AcrR family transcriptional regulator [Corynebacterium phocae]APT92660.1 transcriptional regulator [Corynebacterium phocae]KAA8723713.1 TetR/AcrR family transcriptional regulator [Corynebacterium phocae]